MARGFAERSGGSLIITSAPGAGTTVTLWLREAIMELGSEETVVTADGAGQGQEPRLPLPLCRTSGLVKRILLVDDDDLMSEIVAAQLEAEGFSTVVACTGVEALALLAAGEIVNTMVRDFPMPGMNGAVTIERAPQTHPQLPCILLTGYAGAAATL